MELELLLALAHSAVMMSNQIRHRSVIHMGSCANPVSLSRAGSRLAFRGGCRILCAAQVVGRPQQRSCDSLEEEVETPWLEMTLAEVVGACAEKGWGWGSQAARVVCEMARCCC